MPKNRIALLKQVFKQVVTVNTYGDVAISTEHGKLDMPKRRAKAFVKALLDADCDVQAYWKKCTARERELDRRIREGYRV